MSRTSLTISTLLRNNKSLHCSRCQLRLTSKLNVNTPVKQTPRLNPVKKKGHFTVLSVSTLSVPVICFGLGCWQYQRRKWKLGLLQKIKDRTTVEPIDLPHSVEVLQSDDMEYRHVKLTGEFDHRRELRVGVRPNQHPTTIPRGVKNHGVYILTPFKVKDTDLTVIVNRGWVPLEYSDGSKRLKGNKEGEVTITGIVSREEATSIFRKDQMDPTDPWYWSRKTRDKMAGFLGVDPVIIDADLCTTVEGGPIGGQVNTTLRNKHLDYMITWWLFAVVSFVIWYKKFMSVDKLGKGYLAIMKDQKGWSRNL